MTRASHRALQAASPRHNQLTLDGRRKPKPLPLLGHAPEPKGQDREAIEWLRLKLVSVGSQGRPGAVKARIRLVEFTKNKLKRELGRA